MTLIAVPVMGQSAQVVLAQLAVACACATDIVEWRVDALAKQDAQQNGELAIEVRQQTARAGKQLLVTFRTQAQGGLGQTADSVQTVSDWVRLAQPDWVDVETNADTAATLAALSGLKTQLILSTHDFDQTGTVATRQQQLQRMATLPVAMVKMALMTQTSADALTIMQLNAWAQTALTRPVAVMGMGAYGAVTRLTAPTFGAALTFASATVASAPGQLPIDELRRGWAII